MKVFVESSPSEGCSPALRHFLIQLLSDLSGLEPSKIEALCMGVKRTRNPLKSVEAVEEVARLKFAEIRTQSTYYKHYTEVNKILDVLGVKFLGTDVVVVLEDLVKWMTNDEWTAGPESFVRKPVEAFHVGQMLLFINSLGLVTATKLGTLPENAPNVPKFEDRVLLENWIHMTRMSGPLKFQVQGKLKPIKEDDHLKEALLLVLLFTIPRVGISGPHFPRAKCVNLGKMAEGYFEAVAEWAAKADTDFAKPPEKVLPDEMHGLFYKTGGNPDPQKLHDAIASIVETVAWKEYTALKEALDAVDQDRLELLKESSTNSEPEEQFTKRARERNAMLQRARLMAKQCMDLKEGAKYESVRCKLETYDAKVKQVWKNLRPYLAKYIMVLATAVDDEPLTVTWEKNLKTTKGSGCRSWLCR